MDTILQEALLIVGEALSTNEIFDPQNSPEEAEAAEIIQNWFESGELDSDPVDFYEEEVDI